MKDDEGEGLRDWSGDVRAEAKVRGKRSGWVSAVHDEQKIRPHLLMGGRRVVRLALRPRCSGWAKGSERESPDRTGDSGLGDSLPAMVLASREHAKADVAAVAVADVGVGVSLPEGLR